jgi:hypothetical protein
MHSCRAAVHIVWPTEMKLGIRGLHMTLLDIMRCTEIGARKAVRLL